MKNVSAMIMFRQKKCNSFYYQSINIIFFVILLNNVVGLSAYMIPKPTAKSLTPIGFRISIPDESGVELFAFHGKVNREFSGTEEGEFHGETREKINNEWVYENDVYQFQAGDILYYWVYVQHNKHGYHLREEKFIYPDDFDTRGRPVTARPVVPVITTRTTARPIVTPATPRPTTPTRATPPTPNSCTASITTINKNQPVDCSGKLIFEEQFNSNILNKWTPDVRMPLETRDAEFVLYHKYSSVWNVSNGNLYIFPKLLSEIPGYTEEQIRLGELNLGAECNALYDSEQECQRKAAFQKILPPIVTTRFRTENFFSFKYGIIEIRAKLPKGDWLFPQLFLDPTDDSYYGTTGYANGQIRVAFIRSNDILNTKESTQIDGHRLSGGVVLTTLDTYRDSWLRSTIQPQHYGDDFHTYSLIWTDTGITLKVDGSIYATLNGGFKYINEQRNIPHIAQWQRGESMAPFDREFHITVGVGVGGLADFPDYSTTGYSRATKPWENTSPKAELLFWNAKNNWKPTWSASESGLIVDYIKVWSI